MSAPNFTQWSLPYAYDNGSQSCIAINDNGFVAELHNAPTWNSLYCKTTTLNSGVQSGPLQWTEVTDLGGSPNAGTTVGIDINNENAIIVYQDSDKNVYYQWGTLQNGGIQWSGFNNYTSGEWPTVAINNNNLAIAITQDSHWWSYTLWYAIGTPGNMSDTTIIEIPGGANIEGTRMKVAINNNGLVVIAYQNGMIDGLYQMYMIVGLGATSNGVATWGNPTTPLVVNGDFDIALDDNNNVVFMSSFAAVNGSYLGYIYGTVDEQSQTVVFPDVMATPLNYTNYVGNNITMDMNNFNPATNCGQLIVETVLAGGEYDYCYFYGMTDWNNYSSWMGDYHNTIGNIPLTMLSIPGTHDSGTFPINALSTISPDNPNPNWTALAPAVAAGWSQAQDQTFLQQLNSGIRYFDLRVINWSGNGYYLCHGFYAAPFSDLFNDIATFYQETNNNAEILLLDVNHIYTSVDPVPNFGGGVWMPGGTNSQMSDLCDYINAQISGILLPPSMLNYSLQQIYQSSEYQNGGRIILLFDDTLSLQQNPNYWPNVDCNNATVWNSVDGQTGNQPAYTPAISSPWPDEQDLPDLINANTSVIQGLETVWNTWLTDIQQNNPNPALPANFTVLQCIATENQTIIENGLLGNNAPTLQAWEAGICTPYVASLYAGAQTAINIMLVDWLEQTAVSWICMQFNAQKAQQLQTALNAAKNQ